MKIIIRITLALLLFTFLISSCAKQTEGNYNTMEQLSFDKWMERNGPKTAERFDNGMYIEQLVSAPTTATKVEDGDWIEINFTGTNIHGDIFGTRSKEVAELQGTFTVYTHYVPQKMQILKTSGLSEAEYFTLKRMKQGDKARFYAPSSLYYGSYGKGYANGYQGQTSLAGNIPVIMEIEVATVIKDITAYENKQVKDYAAQWGLTEKDTIGYGANLYVDIISHTEKADTITADSSFKCYYVGKFVDDFIFDTNVDSIAMDIYDVASKTYELFSSANGIEVFKYLCRSKKLTYDSHIRIAFSSTLGYGTTGQTPASDARGTVIQPYTPLVFELWIQSNKKEDDDKEDK